MSVKPSGEQIVIAKWKNLLNMALAPPFSPQQNQDLRVCSITATHNPLGPSNLLPVRLSNVYNLQQAPSSTFHILLNPCQTSRHLPAFSAKEYPAFSLSQSGCLIVR